MAKKTKVTVESKLRALYDLQLIDSRIDEIVNVRGELPLEVEDLENEIAGLATNSEKISAEIEENEKRSILIVGANEIAVAIAKLLNKIKDIQVSIVDSNRKRVMEFDILKGFIMERNRRGKKKARASR